jgi:hypothetical protein
MGECHYLYGNVHVAKEMEVVANLLERSGIGRDRLCLRWVSAAEGRLFAEYVTAFSERIQELGPFDPAANGIELAAAEKALTSQRLRWLMGIALPLTRNGNVYGERVREEDYGKLLERAAEEAYVEGLISEAIREAPLSVREIAFSTGLPVHTVSLRLGELERRREAEVQSYQGTTPRFIRCEG